MVGCNEKNNGVFSTVIIIFASIGLISIIGFLLGNVILIPDSDTADYTIPTDKQPEDKIKHKAYPLNSAKLIDCLVLNDFDDFINLLGVSKDTCVVFIEDNNTVLFDGVNSISDYQFCEIKPKDEWQSMTYQFNELSLRAVKRRELGCFVQEGTFDVNSSHVEVFKVISCGVLYLDEDKFMV